MNLEELRKNWEVFAETDPLWAIMSDPRKRNGRWELAEFFQTGRRQIDETFGFLEEKGVEVRRGRAARLRLRGREAPDPGSGREVRDLLWGRPLLEHA